MWEGKLIARLRSTLSSPRREQRREEHNTLEQHMKGMGSPCNEWGDTQMVSMRQFICCALCSRLICLEFIYPLRARAKRNQQWFLVRQLKITFSSERAKWGENAWGVGREAFPICAEGSDSCNSCTTGLGCTRTLQSELDPTAYL